MVLCELSRRPALREGLERRAGGFLRFRRHALPFLRDFGNEAPRVLFERRRFGSDVRRKAMVPPSLAVPVAEHQRPAASVGPLEHPPSVTPRE